MRDAQQEACQGLSRLLEQMAMGVAQVSKLGAVQQDVLHDGLCPQTLAMNQTVPLLQPLGKTAPVADGHAFSFPGKRPCAHSCSHVPSLPRNVATDCSTAASWSSCWWSARLTAAARRLQEVPPGYGLQVKAMCVLCDVENACQAMEALI